MDILNKAVSATIKQGQQSLKDGICVYRGNTTEQGEVLKCAVGHLISDEHYCPTLEDTNMLDDVVKAAVEASIGRALTSAERVSLSHIQTSHDSVDKLTPFPIQFKAAITKHVTFKRLPPELLDLF